MQTEIWKDIDGYPGYQVSSFGNVRSFYKRAGAPLFWVISKEPQRILKPSTGVGNPYPGVNLRRGGYTNIYALVARAFLGSLPDGQEICHNDGNPQNNHIENLRYDTHQNNARDRLVHETLPLTETQVALLRQSIKSGTTLSEAASIYGCLKSTVSHICHGHAYSWARGPILSGTDRAASPNGVGISFSDADDIRRRYADGEKQVDMANEYGCSISYISHIVHNRRLVTQNAPIIEPRSPSRLTQQKRDELQSRLKSGENRAGLATEYGVAVSYTYKLCPASAR